MERGFMVPVLIIAGFMLGLLLWSGHAVFILGDVSMYGENGPLEALQAVLIALACVVFLCAAVMGREPSRLILYSCSLLCYSFLVRELDVERLNVPEFVKIIGSGAGRNMTLAVAFLTLLLYAGRHFSCYKNKAVLFLKSRPGVLLMVAGLLLWVAAFFEKAHSIPHYVYFEEMIELWGYGFILLSAFAAHYGTKRFPS